MADIIPYDPSVTSFVILIGVICFISGFLFVRLAARYREKRTRISLFMSFNTGSWFLGTLGYFMGLISWYIQNDRGILFKISLPIGYSMIAIATFCAVLFAKELLKLPPKNEKIILIIAAIYTIGLVISFFNFEANQWGALPPIPITRLVNLVLLILGNIITFAILAVKFNGLQKRVESDVDKTTIRFAKYFFTLMLTCFILMVISEVHLMLIDNPPKYGPFEYVAWVVGMMGLLSGYIGLTQPKWFRNRFIKNV